MKRLDKFMLAATLVLLVAGLSTLYSIGVISGERILIRQLVFLCIGIVAFSAAALMDYRFWAKYSRHFYILSILLLIVVLFTESVRGSSRWIQIGGFNLQPTELAKIALILGLARFFAKKKGEVKSGRVIAHVLFFAALPALLVGMQPDLGSAAILIATSVILLFMTPVRRKHIVVVILLFTVLAGFGWEIVLHDYQRERVITFLNPTADPAGSGYNVRQSMIAVGSGQLTGRGLGRGLQSHLRFLPERHTDFIFVSFAEELGFVGSLLLIAAFGLLIWRLIRTALRSVDALGLYLSLGVAILISLQVFINIGMNIGLVPVTGIPLPLVSYGGSSLIVTLFLLGLAQSVYRRSKSVV